jgi:hypothetical protein
MIVHKFSFRFKYEDATTYGKYKGELTMETGAYFVTLQYVLMGQYSLILLVFCLLEG